MAGLVAGFVILVLQTILGTGSALAKRWMPPAGHHGKVESAREHSIPHAETASLTRDPASSKRLPARLSVVRSAAERLRESQTIRRGPQPSSPGSNSAFTSAARPNKFRQRHDQVLKVGTCARGGEQQKWAVTIPLRSRCRGQSRRRPQDGCVAPISDRHHRWWNDLKQIRRRSPVVVNFASVRDSGASA